MNYRLVRITAPHFCAGVEIDDKDKVVKFAPILKWTKGRTLWWLERYCKKKKWEIEVL